MAIASDSVRALCALQNTGGGWGYTPSGSSWTEPTSYALLALLAAGATGPQIEGGLSWIHRARKADGTWSPHPGVAESTWVTALGVLLLAQTRSLKPSDPSIGWLLNSSGKESSWITRLRLRLLGINAQLDDSKRGWPWYPGAAAWVAPTALTMLALAKAAGIGAPGAAGRLQQGREYLQSRMCRDGGWNHGGTRALGYEADSYPETTGMALLALHGAQVGGQSITCARRQLSACDSMQAAAWLVLGLSAHGVDAALPRSLRCRETLDYSLDILAGAALEKRNVLLI